MGNVRMGLLLAATLALSTVVPLSPVSAASSGPISKRSGYVVTPTMMHAIDVIVAEEMKMRRHRH